MSGLPTDDGFTIVELNAAVEFHHDYRPVGDVFREAALELARAVFPRFDEERLEGVDPVLA